jgi:spore coat protein H
MKMKQYIASITFFLLLSLIACGPKKRAEVSLFEGDLFDHNHLHEIRLYFEATDFWDSLVYFKKQKDSLEVSHYLKCDVNIDGTELKDIGIRLKGESSYDFTKGKKKSFKLDLNNFVRKQKYAGVSRLNLNNNYKDPSLLREKLALDKMTKAGLPTPKSAFTRVYLNDEYWGVYLLVEEINKEFLKRNFGSNKGNLYIGEPNGTLSELSSQDNYMRAYRKKNHKKENNWTDLMQFVKVINNNSNEQKQIDELDSVLYVDECLKTFAINNLLVNVDAYNMIYPHNYFLYSDSNSKKMHWINYDYNYSFAAWNPKFTYEEVINLSVFYSDAKHPLANLALNKNKLLKQRYTEIYKQILEETKISEMEESMLAYQKLIRNAVLEDKQKEYSKEEFEKSLDFTLGDKKDPGAFIPGLKEFLRQRINAASSQLSIRNELN